MYFSVSVHVPVRLHTLIHIVCLFHCKRTVYNCSDGKKHHNKNIIVRRPSRKSRADVGVLV